MPNHATLAGLRTASDAPSGALVLDAHQCAFVLRPCWMAPLTRSESRQCHEVRH